MTVVTPQLFLSRVAAVFGFLGVALGAFGAHGFHDLLVKNQRVETWETAVLYQLVHSAVLLALSRGPQSSRLSGWLFMAGIVIFSGTLYILALTNIRWLGAITPLGGVAFLCGWLTLLSRGGARGEN
jgi:uncharacterized membrane protein YgdD (TMEM256/DUF423 family)